MLKDRAVQTIGHPEAPSTLGTSLERRRLEHRARRLRLVIAALGERRAACASAGRVPHALRQAIRDFSAELSSVEAALESRRPARGRHR